MRAHRGVLVAKFPQLESQLQYANRQGLVVTLEWEQLDYRYADIFFPNLQKHNIGLVEDVVAYAYLDSIAIGCNNVQQVALVALSLQSRQLANLCLRFIRAK